MVEPIYYSWEYFFKVHEIPLAAYSWKPQDDPLHCAHGHTFMEIVVLAKGKASHLSCQGSHPMKPGDATVIRPGSWHVFVQPKEAVVFNICFKEDLLYHNLSGVPRDAMTHYLLWDAPRESGNQGIFNFHIPPELLKKLRDVVEMMDPIHNNDQPEYHMLKLGGMMVCLNLLARSAWGTRESPSTPGVQMHPSVRRILALIHEDIAHPWTLSELARRVHINNSYLARLFRQSMRCTLLEYISTLRVEEAARYLITSEEPISTISVKVGWDDPNYFAIRFRKHFGVSASEYRKRHHAHAST